MDSSGSPQADRVTINSRSPHTPTTPQPVFGENEETESFYVILDISGDDFAAYGKYRDGRRFRPRLGDRYYEDDAEGSPPSEDDNEPDEVEDEDEDEDATPSSRRKQGEDDEEDPEDSDAGSENGSIALENGERPRETKMQILDLDSYNPLVNYEGKIYSCTWNLSNGTEMIFEPPAIIPTDPADEGEGASGRKLRQNQEARLLGTTIHRIEGWPGKLKPRGRDKQEVSTKARMFAERMDRVLDHRLIEAESNGEDISGVIMRKFSEGQQAPAGWRETSMRI